MRKRISIGIMALSAGITCGLVGCGESAVQSEKDIYVTLNRLAAQQFASVKLEIAVTVGENTLQSCYFATKTEGGYSVEYSVQRLNPFTSENGVYKAPEEYKSTLKGSMEISNGKIVRQNGAQTDIFAETVTAFGLKFNENYFTDFTVTDGYVTANVISPCDFLQQPLDCSNMKFELNFTEEVIEDMTISYQAATSQPEKTAFVEYRYTFA